MNILANALPGFRDLRGPVIAGYLWLLVIWATFTPDLSSRPSGGFAAEAYDLGQDIGRVPALVALSVAAYLIGSLSLELVQALARLGRRVRSSRSRDASTGG